MLTKRMSYLLLPLMAMASLHAADPFFDDPFGDDLFKEMYEMQKEMDKVFERMHQRMQDRSQHLNQPNAQFYMPSMQGSMTEMFVDKGDHYEYNTHVEANKDNEINLSAKDGILTFKAKITHTSDTKEQGIQSQQSYTSMMQRSQTLPADADADTLKMEEKEGMIVVTIQKKRQKPDTTQEKGKVPTLMPLEKEDKNSTIKVVPHNITQA